MPWSNHQMPKNAFNTACLGTVLLRSLAWEEKEKIKKIVIGEGIIELEEQALSGFSNAESIVFPDSLTKIGTECFSNCYLLKEITFGKNIREIGDSAFSGCVALERLTIPDTVTKVGGYAFYNCKRLKELILPSSLKLGTDSNPDMTFYVGPEAKKVILTPFWYRYKIENKDNAAVYVILNIENKDWAYDRYDIRYSEFSNMKNSNITTLSLNKGNVSKKITGLKKGKTYYFQFRAYIDAESAAGCWVGKRKVKIVR